MAKTRVVFVYVTLLPVVYFLTMASQAGCEIMNSEVAGSILTVFPVKRKKKDNLMFENLENSLT